MIGPVALESRPAWRRAFGRLETLRVRLFARHRHDRLVVEDVAGHRLVVLPRVFNPKLCRSGARFARFLNATWVPEGARVLDVGTGSGVLSIFAARWASSVVAVDSNPEAVRCARLNVELARLEGRIDVRAGDLFEPIGDERFDVVLVNPPYLRGEPADAFAAAWFSTDFAERFAAGLPDHLAPRGHALLILSSLGDVDGFTGALRASGHRVDRLASFDVLSEVFEIYRARRAADVEGVR